MKKIFFILILIAAYVSQLHAQSAKEAFSSTDIVWYGLDFSNAKLIGKEGFANPQDIQNRFFDFWNHLVITEPEKYNLNRVFNKKNVINELDIVEKRNASINMQEMVTNSDHAIEMEALGKIISSYKTKATTGVGVVFIVESFDKLREKGTVYITFFDIATKKILLREKMSEKPGGFGVKNYWAGSIARILNQAEEDYKTWAKRS